jgi:mRNA interferase YafQ
MFLLKFSSRFKKDLKPYRHDKNFLVELEKVLDTLAKGKDLPDRNLNHPLIGEFKGCFECHIKPDILLVYKIEQSELIVLLLRLGSHAKLF